MDEREWQTFVTVVSEGNITKAAKKLFLSQPALSYRLRHIEEVLDSQLLVRQNERIALTPQGEIFYKYCQRMLLEREVLIQELGAVNKEICGTLTIAASINFSDYELPRLLAEFMKVYPKIRVKVRTGYSEEVKKLFNSGAVNVAIVRGVLEKSEYTECLIEEPYYIVNKEPIDMETLVEQPLIQYRTDSSIVGVINEWCKDNLAKEISPTMELDSMVTCRHFIREGLGWSILPFMGLGRCGVEGVNALPLLDKQGQPIKRNTYMIYNEMSIRLMAACVFIEFVRNYYKN